MVPDDNNFTYNPLTNDDKLLLLSHGYKPGELTAEDERDLLRDLHAETEDTDDDSERGVIADEMDGND